MMLILTSPSGLNQSGAYAWGEGISFQFVSVATVGIHERERSGSLWWAARVSIPAP